MVLISSFLKISSNFAFSVLITLPLKGRIAWKRRSRPCLADPPAEYPSTKNSSFFLEFLDWAGVKLQDKGVSLDLFFLPERASSLAFLAASLTCLAFIAFLTSCVDKTQFSSKK